jgi:hypothetical protein
MEGRHIDSNALAPVGISALNEDMVLALYGCVMLSCPAIVFRRSFALAGDGAEERSSGRVFF